MSAKLEDIKVNVNEKIVENVQKGINSSFYRSGRFSPKREKGVHHFHCLISQFINHK